jgi:hypothetical protein
MDPGRSAAVDERNDIRHGGGVAESLIQREWVGQCCDDAA